MNGVFDTIICLLLLTVNKDLSVSATCLSWFSWRLEDFQKTIGLPTRIVSFLTI